MSQSGRRAEMGEVHAAARTLGLESHLEIRRAEDIAPAFEALGPRGGTLCLGDPLVNINRVRINTLALGARLPTIYGSVSTSEAEA